MNWLKASLFISLIILTSCNPDGGGGDFQDSGFTTDPNGLNLQITSPSSLAVFTVGSFLLNGICQSEGQEIRVVLDSVLIGTTICVDGEYPFSIDVNDLSEGANLLKIYYINELGTEIFDQVIIEKDTTGPTVTVTGPNAANASNAGAYSIAGTCNDDEATIAVTVGGASQTVNCASNAWSATFDVSGVGDGNIAYSIQGTDDHTNSGAAVAGNLLKDVVAPSVAITSAPTANAANFSNYSVSGTCNENTRTVTLSFNGGTVTATPSCGGGTFTANAIDLTAIGDTTSLSLSAQLDDAAGNSTTASTTMIKDTIAPTLTLTAPSTINNGNKSGYVFQGTCSEEGRGISGTIDIVPFTGTCASGSWFSSSLDLSFLADATYTVTVSTDDAAGNTTSGVTANVAKDVTIVVPTITITNPSSGFGTTGSFTVRISGIANGDKVYAYSGLGCASTPTIETSTGATHDMTFNVGATEAAYPYTFDVEDTGGNFTGCLGPVIYTEDRTAPALLTGTSLSSPANGSTSTDATPEFSGTLASEEGSTVRIFRTAGCSNQIGSGTVSSSSYSVTGSMPFDGSADGGNSFYATVTDQAGNTSACSDLTLSYTLQPSGLATLPKIAMVGTNIPTSIIALEDNVTMTITRKSDGSQVVLTATTAGEIETTTASQGDRLECTGGCYAVSQGFGTAPWASEAYSGKEFTTYISRYGEHNPNIYVTNMSNTTSFVQLKQLGNVLDFKTVAAGETILFNRDLTNNRSVQISSSQNANVYFVTRSSGGGTYDKDARVLTPAATEVIGYSGYVTGIADGTTFSSYEQDGYNEINRNIDIADAEFLRRTRRGERKWATIVQSNNPVMITQIADYDGINASPSLPTTMMATHFGIPRNAAYVALASKTSGTVTVTRPNGTTLGTFNLTRAGGANANAPFSYIHTGNPAAGHLYTCSVPCYAYYDDRSAGADNDETLMMGTKVVP